MPTVAEPTTQLDSPVESLAGVGEKRAKSLHKLGLRTLGDLLDYLPRDYRFEGSERGVDELVNEQIQTVRGEVIAADYIAGRPRSRFEITLKDGRSGGKAGVRVVQCGVDENESAAGHDAARPRQGADLPQFPADGEPEVGGD